MIPSSSCLPSRQLDQPGLAGHHDGLAAATPLAGTRSQQIVLDDPFHEYKTHVVKSGNDLRSFKNTTRLSVGEDLGRTGAAQKLIMIYRAAQGVAAIGRCFNDPSGGGADA
jgi:hypothetical protein